MHAHAGWLRNIAKIGFQLSNGEVLFKHSAKRPGQDANTVLEPPARVRGRPREELITVISVSHPNTSAKNSRDGFVIHRLGQSKDFKLHVSSR